MDSKFDAKAQVLVPEAYFRRLKKCWDDSQRSGHSDARSSTTANVNDPYFQREFRNIPQVRKRPLSPPRTTPASSSEKANDSDEDMEGAGKKKTVEQTQRDVDLSLAPPDNTLSSAVSSAVAEDNCTEQFATPAELREVAPAIRGSLNDGTLISAEKPADINAVLKPKENITFNSGDDWFYLG